MPFYQFYETVTFVPLNSPVMAFTILFFFIQSEYIHRHPVLHAHKGSCQIHHRKLLVNHFLNGDLIILHCVRIQLRIAVIHTVNRLCEVDSVASISIARRTMPYPSRNMGVPFLPRKIQPFPLQNTCLHDPWKTALSCFHTQKVSESVSACPQSGKSLRHKYSS